MTSHRLVFSKEPNCGTADFTPLARLFRWMELFSFGPWLQRCRCAFLSDMAASRRALLLGDGDGRFTAQFLRLNLRAEIDAVDASSAMLQALLRHAGSHAVRVHVHHADARVWQPARSCFDLVVSHFFLDCLTTDEVRALAVKVRAAVSPSAAWVISEFAIPQGLFGHFVARPLVWFLYRAFGILTGLTVHTLPDHSTALRAVGFALLRRRAWLHGLLVSEIWSANPTAGQQGG